MSDCIGCGVEYDIVTFMPGRNRCRKCYNLYIRERSKQIRAGTKVEKENKRVDPKPQALLKKYINLWESKTVSISELECFYIECCKAMGHDRKPNLMKEWNKSHQIEGGTSWMIVDKK